MKSFSNKIIKIFAIIALSNIAISKQESLPIVVTHQYHSKKAKTLKNILEKKFKIPHLFIGIKKRYLPCERLESPVLQICISSDGIEKAVKYDSQKFYDLFGYFLEQAE